MSQVAPLPATDGAKLSANQAVIRGRVTEVKSTEDQKYTVISLPAPDAYSKPQVVEVRSKRLLGKPQDDVTVRVAIEGYRRKGGNDRHGDPMYFTTNLFVAIED